MVEKEGKLVLIAAVAENGVIGNNNSLPWEAIKEDIRHFRELTIGHPVIMGRSTYLSIPSQYRPLEGRTNIVLSKQDVDFGSDVTVCSSIDDALSRAERCDTGVAFVAGGAQVYAQTLELADRIELTSIHREYAGDILFPSVDWDQWNLVKDEHPTDWFSFLTYEKKELE